MTSSSITDNINQMVINTTYAYDKVGNCIQTVEDGVTTVNAYNYLNQLVEREVSSSEGRNSLTFYSYYANGNQTVEQTMVNPPTVTQTIQKEYDANNQLIKVTCREGSASGTIEYTQENKYNCEEQKISKTDNGVKTCYYYQGSVLLYTTDSNGKKART